METRSTDVGNGEALGSYLLEPAPTPPGRERSHIGAAVLVGLRDALLHHDEGPPPSLLPGAPGTPWGSPPGPLVMRRILLVDPTECSAVLERWCGEERDGVTVWLRVRDRTVEIRVQPNVGDVGLARVAILVRRPWLRRPLRLELDVSAFSSWRTGLELRPSRRVNGRVRYFAFGHEFLDRLSALLAGTA